MKDWKLLAQLIRERLDSSSTFTPPPGGWEAMSERLSKAGPPSSATRIRDVIDESYHAVPPTAAWEAMSARLTAHSAAQVAPKAPFFAPYLKWISGIVGAATVCLIAVLWLNKDDGKQETDHKTLQSPHKNVINQPGIDQILTPSRLEQANQAGPNYLSKDNKNFDKSNHNIPIKENNMVENRNVIAKSRSNVEEMDAFQNALTPPIPFNNDRRILHKSENRMRNFFIRIPDFIKNQPTHALSVKFKAQIWKNWGNSQSNYIPSIGLQYRFMPTDVFGFETGIEISFQNGMDVVHEVSQIEYGLTKRERLFTLEPTLGVFLDIPLRATFQASSRSSWSLGGRAQFLLDTKGTLTEFEVNDSILNEVSTITQFGYKQGMNTVNFALELAYQLQVSEKLSIGSEVIWGMTDITSNDFFMMNRNDYNRGVNINIIYNFFKQD